MKIECNSKPKFNCQWNNGDTFAYKIESELAKEKGLIDRFFVIRIVDDYLWNNEVVVPIVYVKITKDNSLPLTVNEYDKMEYVQTWFTRYEDRFLPIDMTRPSEDIAEKSKMKYTTDDYGFLPQYRLILLNTSKRVIPKKLIYLGSYPDAANPSNEFIPHTKDNIVVASWKVFEDKMINRYCEHNLKELRIYNL